MNDNKPLQYHYLFDWLKFLMAFGVIAIHCWIEDYSNIGSRICSIAVPTFFCLTGFLVQSNNSHCGIYLLRIIRIYLIWVLIYTPLSLYERLLFHEEWGNFVYWYIRNLFIQGDFFYAWHLWYLLAVIQVIAVYFIFKKLHFQHAFFIVGIIVFFIYVILHYNCLKSESLYSLKFIISKIYPKGQYVFITGYVYILLGCLAKIYLTYFEKKKSASILLLIISLFAFVYDVPFSKLLFAFFLVVNAAFYKTEKFEKGIIDVRKLSTIIYLTHMIPLSIIQLFYEGTLGFWWQFCIGSIITFCICLGILRLTKKYRFLSRLY